MSLDVRSTSIVNVFVVGPSWIPTIFGYIELGEEPIHPKEATKVRRVPQLVQSLRGRLRK